MRSTNLFILRGHAGADARAFDGGKVAKLSVATNRVWVNRETRERKEAVDWVTLTVLNEKIARWALENIKKGDPIYAECRVTERNYQKDGRRTTAIATGTAPNDGERKWRIFVK